MGVVITTQTTCTDNSFQRKIKADLKTGRAFWADGNHSSPQRRLSRQDPGKQSNTWGMRWARLLQSCSPPWLGAGGWRSVSSAPPVEVPYQEPDFKPSQGGSMSEARKRNGGDV